jgi:hypothetical protein
MAGVAVCNVLIAEIGSPKERVSPVWIMRVAMDVLQSTIKKWAQQEGRIEMSSSGR